MTASVYLVGGAVRDKLLGREPKDRDWVVVRSTVEEMLSQGFKQVGAKFPVFLHPETGEEYALARTEQKTGPGYTGFDTRFTPDTTLEEDLARRDLTINAMAMDAEGNLIDPFGGAQDLKDKVLRHTTEAFAEDPLRVLRLARFAARYNFTIAPKTVELAIKLVDAGELEHLSPERIWQEINGAFGEGIDQPSMFLITLWNVGALTKVQFFKKLFGISYLYSLKIACYALDDLASIPTNNSEINLLLKLAFTTELYRFDAGDNHEQLIVNWVSKRRVELADAYTACEQSGLRHPTSFVWLTFARTARREVELIKWLIIAMQRKGEVRLGADVIFHQALSVLEAIRGDEFVKQGLTGKAVGTAMLEAQVNELDRIRQYK